LQRRLIGRAFWDEVPAPVTAITELPIAANPLPPRATNEQRPPDKARSPAQSRRRIMTRAKILLIAASCAVTIATASPALALNPQPLPPGRTASTHVFCANGNYTHR
jgi:hypothetical protein